MGDDEKKIEFMDEGLKRYFAQYFPDEVYDADNRLGLKSWCEDNGMDEDAIAEELDPGYSSDCMLIDDELHVPLPKGANF
eukprot:CAMPEP_0201589002 /NCGR_PEP_ID=MMETSP0190_2-20130828/161606_1 /ASSEMBLY_ACC=CAM_ASM_000263 /TAXON_ID=37353 /ORGANISM="Rosalina sp." /LENGTH=79 /DNA_ID=CAMNT_0048042265 /DNA_START=9 /DNA_END=245 /DNA_ORIENTATION=-